MNIRKVNINDYDDVANLYTQLFDAEKGFDDNIVDTYSIDEKVEKIIKVDLSHPRARGQDVFLKYRTQILEILDYAGKVQEVEYAI